MKRTEVIAYHGWGFDASCWKKWKEVIPENFSFAEYNRGYFSAGYEPQFSQGDHNRVIFAHSYGLHLCKPEMLNKADLVVVFGGFVSFHPQAPQLKRRSRFVLNQMISRFDKEPRKVLEDFYKNVFYPQEGWRPPENSCNEGLLLHDLKDLHEHKLVLKQLNKTVKFCILHGFKDGIVSRAKGRELYDELQDNAKYFEVKEAGHALPFMHVEQCWSFIKPEIEELLRR